MMIKSNKSPPIHHVIAFFDKPSHFSDNYTYHSCSSYCEGLPSLVDPIPFYREENCNACSEIFHFRQSTVYTAGKTAALEEGTIYPNFPGSGNISYPKVIKSVLISPYNTVALFVNNSILDL